MSVLLNDLRPRYPRPRPLTLREEWAALRARLDTVAECLEKPSSLRRRYAICQARYEELLAGKEPPPPPPLDPAVCALCGAPAGPGGPRRIAPALPPAPGDALPLCELCRLALGETADPLAHLAATDRAPSLALARSYLALVRAYDLAQGFGDRFYLLDLLRRPHPIDLAGLDRDFAFLAQFIRSAGRRPELAEEARPALRAAAPAADGEKD